jgi:PTS system nitrogen regulatory IIA component
MRHDSSPSPDWTIGEIPRGAKSLIASTGDAAASTEECPQLINLNISAKDKHELFGIAVDMLQHAYAVDPALILRALWRREEAGSTGLGKGVAISHVRIPGIAKPLTMLLRTRAPIPFDAPDGKPVSLALVIIVPVDDATEQHLGLLARFASVCTDRTFRTRLMEAADAEVVRSVFVESGAAAD